MLKHHLTIALRHVLNSKGLSLLHVLGLSVGIAAFFMACLFVNFELSFDNFHPHADQIYRVALERRVPGGGTTSTTRNFAGLRNLLTDNFPTVEATTGFYKTPANTGVLFKYNGVLYNESGGEINADSSFFRVFSGLLLHGNPGTALADPTSVVLAESMANKVFGNVDPIGRHLLLPTDDGEAIFTVTGIFRDIPANSHFHAKFIVPRHFRWRTQQPWNDDLMLTYVKLQKGVDPVLLTTQLNEIYRQLEHTHPALKGARSFLQPITSIHLSSHLANELEANGSKTLVATAALVGFIILLMAWINYINLEGARFTTRAREIGVRQVIGSKKSTLALQFLFEYLWLFSVAAVLALAIIWFTLPHLSSLTGITYQDISWSQSTVWLTAFFVLTLGSVLAGICPAFYILTLNPIPALKNKVPRHRNAIPLRRSLVVVQFCASLILLGFVLIIRHQLDFMQNADKKVGIEHVITIRNPTAYSGEDVFEKHKAYLALENKLMQVASVKMITSSSAIPGTEIGFTYVDLLKRQVNDPFDPTPYKTLFADYNYIPFFEVKLLAGENFHAAPSIGQWKNPWEDDEWLTLILNESAIQALGFKSPEDAVGEMVEFENFEDHFQKHRIIGVIEDYHHEAINKKVLPMIISPNYGSFQQVYYSVKLHANTDPAEAIAAIEQAWKQVFPDKPFDAFFLDQYYDHQFRSEQMFKRIFTGLAAVAIFIACLGVIGITVFETKARLKEISIRKVLGASVSSLLTLLSKENVKIILVSVAVSIPLLWTIAVQWLSSYPSRIAISPIFFLVPVLVIAVMVAVTSLVHLGKAVRSNPVDHLRNE